jgi:hypothetical protein
MITRWPENANLFEDHRPVRHQSKADPELVYYAQFNPGPPNSFMVVADSHGIATEAHDDWFINFKDANEIAKQMADAPEATINL